MCAALPRLLDLWTVISCRWDTGGDGHRRIMAKHADPSDRRFSDRSFMFPLLGTALSKHADPSDRHFSDRSFRFPLLGTALSKHADPSDRRFSDRSFTPPPLRKHCLV